MAKKIKNFRMTEEGIAILAALAAKKGVSEASVVEMLVRDEASRINVTVPKPDK